MELIRKSIIDLEGYEPSLSDYRIKLDANEGENLFFNDLFTDNKFAEGLNLNKYPDSSSFLLRQEIGKYIGIDPGNIIAGNGSSEMIELVMKTYIDKNDCILSPTPTFSMYSIFTRIYSGKFLGFKTDEDFSFSMDDLINTVTKTKAKIVILCNPNNPTGYLISNEDIRKLLKSVNSIVIVDEAYIEFAGKSIVEDIDSYSNLIVLRTLSKAFGLAGLRLGYMVAGENIIKMINKIKSPYNLNSISQYLGVRALRNSDIVKDYIEEVKVQREYLYKELKKLPITVYPSYGNFLLFKSEKKELGKALKKEGVLIRDFTGDLNKYYRVTVGKLEENEEFLKTLKKLLKDESC